MISNKQIHNHFKALDQKGFALISSISIMALLVMITLATLTLSTSEMRKSTHSKHQQEAQANARMALMVAMGELQKFAGADQRITAESSILEDPDDPSQKLANRHWVGVWRSDALKGEAQTGAQPIIYRNTDNAGADAGSLIDRRENESAYDKGNEALAWLVSHADSATSPDPTQDISGKDSVLLVGPNSTNNMDDAVHAYRVPITQNGVEKGGYAWWVGDEGVKARFDLVDAKQGLAHEQPWLTPAQAGINIAEGYENYESSSPQDIQKSTTRNSSDLSGSASDAALARKKNFHDLTFSSAGLLTDTREGGLKRDLSSFFVTGNAPALGDRPGLDPSDPIIDSEKLRDLSAKFGLLRHWNNLSNGHKLSSGLDPIPPSHLSNGTAWGWYSLNYTGSAPNLATQDTTPLHPVMIEAGISYGLSLTKAGNARDGKTPFRLNLHYYPRIVLWNPYNVKINAASYVSQISMPHRFDVRVIVPGAEDIVIDPKYTFLTGFHDRYKNLPHRPYFSIPATSFEPGEALLFTADAGGSAYGSKTWGDNPYNSPDNVSYYALSCQKTPPLTEGFHIRMNEPTLQIPTEKIPQLAYKIHARPDNIYKLFFYKLYLNKGSGGNFSQIGQNASAFPPLQHISQTENGSSGSEGPWYSDDGNFAPTASARLREMKDGPLTPFYRFKWGHRLQWVDETNENKSVAPGSYNTPFLGYNIIANHNMRAAWHVRSPIEVAYRATNAGGRYVHGMAIDDPYGWDWSNSSLNPVPVKGKNRVSPFGRPAMFGGQNFPVLDVPSEEVPVVSLGAFQHAPISQFAWHPTNAIGNSLVDPRVARNRSSNYVSPSDWGQIGIKNQKWDAIRQAHANPQLNQASFLHDLSYESNFALWDKYFISTIDADYTTAEPLDNPRITVASDSHAPAVDDLKNYHLAAKHLMVKGAFNVNSTSETAWAALLASFRNDSGMEITLQNGEKLTGNDIYSRFLTPYKEQYDSHSLTDPETWTGHRKLDDTQIKELAKEIVKEVKQRGPFISLSDFINRRLVEPPSTSGSETAFTKTGLKGTLQAAIDRTSINTAHLNLHPIPKTEYAMGGGDEQVAYGSSYPELTFPAKNGSSKFGLKPDHNHWADSKLVGSPSFLTQADLLQKFGSVLSARSDTFVIRSYGESKNARGVVKARAWCEAIVQRTQTPILAGKNGIDPEKDISNYPLAAYGRRFKIVSFRWLKKSEI